MRSAATVRPCWCLLSHHNGIKELDGAVLNDNFWSDRIWPKSFRFSRWRWTQRRLEPEPRLARSCLAFQIMLCWRSWRNSEEEVRRRRPEHRAETRWTLNNYKIYVSTLTQQLRILPIFMLNLKLRKVLKWMAPSSLWQTQAMRWSDQQTKRQSQKAARLKQKATPTGTRRPRFLYQSNSRLSFAFVSSERLWFAKHSRKFRNFDPRCRNSTWKDLLLNSTRDTAAAVKEHKDFIATCKPQ